MYISYIQIESNVLYNHPLLLSQIIFDRTEHSLKYNFFFFFFSFSLNFLNNQYRCEEKSLEIESITIVLHCIKFCPLNNIQF